MCVVQCPYLGSIQFNFVFKDDFSGLQLQEEEVERVPYFSPFWQKKRNKTINKFLTLRSDNDGKYLSKEFINWLSKMGIKH
jgi:hypothetical protein